MIAMIVDDEKHVRDAIKLLVPWTTFGIDTVLEAQDGAEAVEMLRQHRPQLVFTDMMMPLMNGMELMAWLSEHLPSAKTIVISGHDEFDLVRHAIKHGGVDYILKPIDAEQLVETTQKTVALIRKEQDERRQQQSLNMEMNQIKPVYWDTIWSNLVSEPKTYEKHAKEIAEEYGLSPDVTSCRLAVLSLDTISGKLKDRFWSQWDLVFFSLMNVCNEVLTMDRGQRIGVAFRFWNSENEIVLLLFRELERSEAVFLHIQECIVNTFQSSMDIGVSGVHPFPDKLKEAYAEAKQALRRRNLLARQKRIHEYDDRPPLSAGVLSMSEYAEAIRLAVRSGSEEQIRKSVGEWIDAVRRLPSINTEQLELWWHEYNTLKTRWMSEWFGDGPPPQRTQDDAPFHVPMDDEGRLSIDMWEQQLVRSLTELSKHMLKSQQQDSNVMFEIAKYIRNHYHQDITLQEIANHFYLSREYISRKFKQEFGENLSDYLSGIRIDKAKLLLLNPHLRIAQVAAMVGYEDEKYFSKVFKKTVGVSPNEYRKGRES
ncbi:response regulator [Paenibacillus validus]|uniref:response regulator n=1 Tax=Paenibacillus TaxID=44249 RepID=UPI000FD97B10|nr:MULTISPECIES: response regulator [Paenibacillus]MED4600736.1 response regulator [Paenibacillus validus]MED4606193.1 response regulator [Paenibacillus validus]